MFAMKMPARNWVCALVLLLAWCGSARADSVFYVSVNTSPLTTNPNIANGPFAVDFQLNDGSGTNDGNNTAMLSNFTFGAGGSLSGVPSLTGGASGDMAATVMLTDTTFFNDFSQGFTPGSVLTFKVDLTTNVDGGLTPDQFSFAILDSSGGSIPTTDLAGSLVTVNLDSTAAIQTFSGTGFYSDVTVTITPVVSAAAPLPTTFAASAILLALAAWRWRRSVRAAAAQTQPVLISAHRD
ncbi:MAG: sorting protein [Phycisphaerales bacterium]|jgi:hypothetical protein|nr:sorting protein [Phycisphaerales bacterium]